MNSSRGSFAQALAWLARGRTLRALVFGASISVALASGCSKSERTEGTVKPSDSPAGKERAVPGQEGKVLKEEALPEASVILADHVNAAGGQGAIDAIKSIYTEAALEVKAQSLRGRVKSWWKNGHFFIEETIEGVGRTRAGYDGKKYWSDDPISQLRELQGAEAEQYSWASAMFLPAQWQTYFSSAKTVGAREVQGEVLYDVELVTKGGETITMSFDKATKLMREQKFEQISAMGKIPLTVRLLDYKAVGGYKFPHRQDLVTPILTGQQTYEVFQVNVDVNEELFAMPLEHDLVPADPKQQKIAPPPRG